MTIKGDSVMQHYTSTIISKYKIGKLDAWVTWIKRGRSQQFCDSLDGHIAATLDNFYYGETA